MQPVNMTLLFSLSYSSTVPSLRTYNPLVAVASWNSSLPPCEMLSLT